MRISLNWLKKYVDIKISDEELVRLIGARLVEVEGVIDETHKYDNIYVVRVESVEKIPDTHLALCKINVGNIEVKNVPKSEGLVQVMCGAPNVHKGMLAAWIAPGAIVPASVHEDAPFVIGKRKMLGKYDSYGMLAAADELDLGVDHNNEFQIDNLFYYYSFWKHTLPPLLFSGLLAGIGGYNNDFKILYECKVGALTIYMHNYFLGCGVNFKLKLPYTLKFISDHLNIHLLGWNLIPLFCSIATVLLWDFLYFKKGSDEIKTEPNENIENKEKKVEESIIGRVRNCIGNVFSVALYGNRMMQKYYLANILGCEFENDNTPLMFMFTSRLLLDTVQCISIEIPLINGHCSIMLNLGTTLIALIIGKLYEGRIVSEDYIYKTILPQSSTLFDNIQHECKNIQDDGE